MKKQNKSIKKVITANIGYTVLATVPYQKCPVCEGKVKFTNKITIMMEP